MRLSNFIQRPLLWGLAMALALFARSAMAQPVITFNFDENGNGTYQFTRDPPNTLLSLGNITDPSPYGTPGVKPLAYNIFASIGANPRDGDIILTEVQNAAEPPEYLRFYQGLLMIYSGLPDPNETPVPLADVGVPPLTQPNAIVMPEQGPEAGPNGMFGYAPGPGGPGELSAPTAYNFTSDPSPVPEPSSLALLGLGAFVLLRRRPRKPLSAILASELPTAPAESVARCENDNDLFYGLTPALRNATRKQIVLRLLVGVGLLLAWARSTPAAIVVNFDEFGNGTITGLSANPVPLISLGNIADPVDPTNGLTPLVYDLTGSISAPVQSGDVAVIEIPGQLPPSDLVRFYSAQGKGWIIVYSDRAEPGETPIPSADVGFSATGVGQTPFLTLLETGPEAGPNGLFGYTPNPGDPGFVPTPPGPVIYNFLSDGAVPEPASMGLVIFGGTLALLARRRRR